MATPGATRGGQGDDVADKALGKVIPYGVYDDDEHRLGQRGGRIMIRPSLLWRPSGGGGGGCCGRPGTTPATRLLITADGGGSNGSRCRLWKVELQRLANETGLRISV